MSFEVPNIRHLRVFLVVVDAKSISKASEKVFLSQPAITQAIAKLETALETSFFNRRSDGMYVTESGEVFAGRVRRALNMIQQGIKDTVRIGDGKGGQASHLLQMLTTTQLRALVAVSEVQNFSIAGRNLGVSQSSLHRAARELESLLEVTLFEKTSIGISTSKAARILARAVKLAFAEIKQGWDEVNALHNREVGQILIGSMPLARTSILPKAIVKFSDSYPDFKISVNDGPYDDLLTHLRHGDLDFLIGALRFPAPSDDVVQEELFSSPVTVVARPDHPLCKVKNVTLEQLAQYSWVVPRKGTPTRAIFDSIFTEAEMEIPEKLVETSSQILIRSLLRDSDRLTVISEHQIQHELMMKMLVTVPFDLSETSRPIGLTLRKDWQPTKKQQQFLDLLRENGRLIGMTEE